MFRTFLYGAVLGSLVFAATESYVHAGTPKSRPKAKDFKFNPRTDVTRDQSAPELGFVVDILDMKDWKTLRDSVEPAPFSTLATDGSPQNTPRGGS